MSRRIILMAITVALMLGACAGGTADTTSPAATRPVDRSTTATPGTTVAAEPPGSPIAEPAQPPPDRDPFYVDGAAVNVMESYPIQVSVTVSGSMPTPCHTPGWKIETVGEEIRVLVFSLPAPDPELACADVLEPAEVVVPLGSFSSGAYTVLVNGEPVGSFEA